MLLYIIAYYIWELEAEKERITASVLDIPDDEFVSLFRLSKECFSYIFEWIEGEFSDTETNEIPPILKLAATLRFLAQGSDQEIVEQEFYLGMSQSTFSAVMAETLEILERVMCPNLINWQSRADERECKAFFLRHYGIPGVVMCVDGTHVAVTPAVHEQNFVNREGYHSLNVMLACNHRMEFLCVDAKFGGRKHDSGVWERSHESSFMEENYNRGDTSIGLAGSTYAIRPWMITPYRDPLPSSANATFNKFHNQAWATIERCIGYLKNRFRCLLRAGKLNFSPEQAGRIVNVCVMLHNACVKFGMDMEEGLPRQPRREQRSKELPHLSELPHLVEAGNIRRDAIRDRLLRRSQRYMPY